MSQVMPSIQCIGRKKETYYYIHVSNERLVSWRNLNWKQVIYVRITKSFVICIPNTWKDIKPLESSDMRWYIQAPTLLIRRADAKKALLMHKISYLIPLFTGSKLAVIHTFVLAIGRNLPLHGICMRYVTVRNLQSANNFFTIYHANTSGFYIH